MTINISEKINILDIISPSDLRTVENQRALKGKYEFPIVFEFKRKVLDKLSFDVPWDGKIYGFVRLSKALSEFLRGKVTMNAKFYVNDWDGAIVFIVEDDSKNYEVAYHVDGLDIIYLLEGALRIPSQRDLDKVE